MIPRRLQRWIERRIKTIPLYLQHYSDKNYHVQNIIYNKCSPTKDTWTKWSSTLIAMKLTIQSLKPIWCWSLQIVNGSFPISVWARIKPRTKMYLPFPDCFEIKRMSVLFQINRKIVNTIWIRFDPKRFISCVVRDGHYKYFKNIQILNN